MEAGLQERVAFYLTGRRRGIELDLIDGLELRPALLAGYSDLTRLRYDFPLVLGNDRDADPTGVRSLSAIVDDVVQEIAQGVDCDRLTWHALRLEREIRAAVAAGASGSLSVLWDEATGRLGEQRDEQLTDSLKRARTALKADGEVVDFGKTLPSYLLRHIWSRAQDAKAEPIRADIGRLIHKLSDILQVDFAHSEAGRSADNLRATFGAAHAELFDFEAMSRLLGKSSAETPLPVDRRQRIERLLAVLTSQQFFRAPDGAVAAADGAQPYSFAFLDCCSALAAYRERLPRAIDLAKAMAIAELEIESQYSEARHETLFANFGVDGVGAQEIAQFPDYLVCLSAEQLHGAETDALMEALSTGLPMKVLVQTDDILEELGIGDHARVGFGLRSTQLARMAIGLNDVFVLQASGSHLYQLRDRILKGLGNAGPALFSVFSGASDGAGKLPSYLIAAAAMESRAFPAFVYDPAAGETWAERFDLEANPQLDVDWPAQRFTYEDEHHQRVVTSIEFTLVDFVACDRRSARHLARLPRAAWDDSILPVGDYLSNDANGTPEKTPCLMMVDRENMLQQVIIDDKLIRVAKRCREAWHSLQELGGTHNSHAERLLARERQAWEAHVQQMTTGPASPSGLESGSNGATIVALEPGIAPAEQEPAPSSDDAYIESARCTSCNECIQINGKMFGYNENRQAHIVDPGAGTYRQLVEAAESCQVAIIHPGKPRNPNEPGIEELIKRAEAFR